MASNNSWLQFSISRKISDDNEKLGIDRWVPASMGEYANLVVSEMKDQVDTGHVTFTAFQTYNNEQFYTITARLAFDASRPVNARALFEDLHNRLSQALPENSLFDVEAMIIEDFTFRKEAVLTTTRDPFTSDLLNLSTALRGIIPLTATWFDFQVNEKNLQGDTLIPIVDDQISRMEEKLAFAKTQPLIPVGGNRTKDRQTRVMFMNMAPKDSKMSALLREKVLEGDVLPEDFIAELKTAREALTELVKRFDFKGKPARLNPGQEVQRLAQEFGPTIDRGGAQMRPEYIERTLSDFPLDSLNGKMMRYGMFLASHLALEIIEGMGGTVNIREFHSRLANELGATVTPPSPSVDDEYTSAPGL